MIHQAHESHVHDVPPEFNHYLITIHIVSDIKAETDCKDLIVHELCGGLRIVAQSLMIISMT